MISLNYRDSRPIYEQVKEEFRNLVVTGALEAGDKLPSVRELSVQLAINPNTIQRAYRELEQEGYIYTIPGKGSFAAGDRDVTGSRKTELFRTFDSVVKELRFLGVTDEALEARLGKGRQA